MKFEKRREEGKLIYSIIGKLDVNTSPELQKDLEATIDGPCELVFDLTDLKYISSAGLRVMVFTQQKMGEEGSVIIEGANDFILEILETTGLIDVFVIR